MLDFIIGLIPTLIVLGVLIFIHELGHFVCAKLSGVSVLKFSIGFGPKLFEISHKGTAYTLSLIPFGGFVKMAGETIDDCEDGKMKKDDFLAQSPIKRFLIVVFGSVMNYILGFCLLVCVFFLGKPALAPVVGDLVTDYPAIEAGVQAGDVIQMVNDENVRTWSDVQEAIASSEGNLLHIEVFREGKDVLIDVPVKISMEKTIFGDEAEFRKIGIYPSNETLLMRYPFGKSIINAGVSTYTITALTLKSLYRLVTGRLSPKNISGPLGIMIITSKTAERGIMQLLQLTAFISISLAIFNLLPIPALDGGHLFFVLCEMVIRKPISFKIQERFAQVGFACLMILMLFVVWNDAINFDVIGKIKNLLPFLN